MTCKSCKIKPVWKFTNQIQLCKNCFCDYFERKVFATIRKYQLMPKSGIFKIKKDNSINTNVLIFVLKKKFEVISSRKSNINSESLSSISEEIFSNIIKGNFNKKVKISPMFELSDPEIKIYAELNNLKGKTRVKNKQVRDLFEKFTNKNKDLEHNILNAFQQIP